MRSIHKPLRMIAALLALALLGACLPAALAEGSFEAIVTVDSMKVYAQQSPHGLVGTLPRGTVVTVTAWSGIAALITCNGMTGIARVSDMARFDGGTAAPSASPAPQTTDPGVTPRAMVTNRETRIYSRPSTSSRYGTVQAGTSVQLLAVNGTCARVSIDGRVGYMVYSHLSEPQADPQPSAEPTAATVQTGNMAVVTTQAAPVYEHADFTGATVTLPKGTKLTLLALRGDVAMVARDGAIGYMSAAFLKKDGSDAEPTQAPQAKKNPFSTGSNEYVIYAFLTGEMGLNKAAAMGVMANIYFESGYRPVINGDGGTSYGICQWHAGRKTNLISWCEENGLDYTTLDGQLQFFRYEVKNRYPSVHSYLKQVENSADGAYDAGYYFCFNYEAPAARTSQSTKRAEYARDTLFAK